MNRLFLLLLLIWLAAGAALGAYVYFGPGLKPADGRGDARDRQTALPVLGSIPEFSLVERSGKRIDAQALKGRVWVAGFIFTRCAGTCPMMIARMSELQEKIASDEDVLLVCITVDPEYDTPEQLRKYADLAGADADHWLFLTGEKDAIYGLARQHFRLSVGGAGGEDEPILHSNRFALVDAEGQIRGYYDGSEPGVVAPLLTDIKRLRTESPR